MLISPGYTGGSLQKSGCRGGAQNRIPTVPESASTACLSGVVHPDDGKTAHSGHSKELCDMLTVFGNHILIFSDMSDSSTL